MSDKPEIIEILCCVPVHLRRKLLDWCNMTRDWLFKDEQPLSNSNTITFPIPKSLK